MIAQHQPPDVPESIPIQKSSGRRRRTHRSDNPGRAVNREKIGAGTGFNQNLSAVPLNLRTEPLLDRNSAAIRRPGCVLPPPSGGQGATIRLHKRRREVMSHLRGKLCRDGLPKSPTVSRANIEGFRRVLGRFSAVIWLPNGSQRLDNTHIAYTSFGLPEASEMATRGLSAFE